MLSSKPFLNLASIRHKKIIKSADFVRIFQMKKVTINIDQAMEERKEKHFKMQEELCMFLK